MLSILWFIVAASAKNRVRAQLRRLKQPRYLVATIAGLLYFWSVFLRRLRWDGAFGDLPAPMRVLIPFGAGLVGVLLILPPWLFPKQRAALTFSEAEIQLLFPGPVSRTSLILYKLARSFLLIFISAAIATLLFGMRISGHGLWFLVGMWLALALLTVHEIAASFAREALWLRGARGVAVLFAGIGAVVLGAAALVFRSLQQLSLPDPDTLDLAGLAAFVEQVERTPIGRALLPFRAPIEAAFAPDWIHFARAAALAAAVLFALTLLLLRSDHAFEEASVIAAERRARQLEARRTGHRRLVHSQVRSRHLPATGRPEWALAWKGRIAARRLFGPQLFGLVIPVVGLSGMLVLMVRMGAPIHTAPGWNGALGLGLFLSALLLVVLGPNAVRADLRMDLPQMDLLRTLPLSGAQVVAGELLGPLGVIVTAQWACLGLALVVSLAGELPQVPVPLRIVLVLSAAVLTPTLTLLGLIVHNAAVLLFPGWVAVGIERARGFEAMGQRLLTFVGGFVVWMVALLPAALLGGVALLVVWTLAGPILAPLAAVVASAVLGFEAFFAVVLLGRRFDAWDLTLEAPPG